MGAREDAGGATRRKFLQVAAGGVATATGAGWLAACGGDSGSTTTAATTAATGGGEPKKGGTLRMGMIGGGQIESLNPNHYASSIDIPREQQIFESLVTLDPDLKEPVAQLAETFEHSADFKTWTFGLRKGVTWHDGKDFTAEDVMFNMRNWMNPKNDGFTQFGQYIKRMRKRDTHTVEVQLSTGVAFPWGQLGAPSFLIVQDGEKTFKNPAGTGPFKLDSFTPGQDSMMSRNENYWDSGKPLLDKLQIVSFNDTTAQYNALQSGKIDAMVDMPYAQAKAIKDGGSGPIKLLITDQAGGAQFAMRVDVPPFNDLRVRQAMRLVCDRQAMVDTVFLGFGAVSNDLPGSAPLPYYDESLPQREQDIEKAKSLLKAAGKESITLVLHTTAARVGYVEAATLLAQQAKEAGINIKIKQEQVGSYFDPTQLAGKMTFSMETDQPFPSLPSSYLISMVSAAPFNSSHWKNKKFDDLVTRGLAEDPNGDHPLWNEAQKLLWDEGGLLTWGHQQFVDGLADKVQGIKPHKMNRLGNFDFRQTWLSA